MKITASRSFNSSPKKSPVHSVLTSSAEEESGGSTPQYRSTKPVHSPNSAKGKKVVLLGLADFLIQGSWDAAHASHMQPTVGALSNVVFNNYCVFTRMP